ncbi:MAG: hypothetical protein RIC15_05700 [Vicingaceae bacterium]
MRLMFLMALISITMWRCDKSADQNNLGIPYVPINEMININDPKYQDLKNIGGWTYLVAGSRGIILYRESTGVVKAFERHCTYDPVEVCSTVDMDVTLLQANDFDCCGSVFSILNGTIIKGPASRPLLQYQTSFDGTIVTVTN